MRAAGPILVGLLLTASAAAGAAQEPDGPGRSRTAPGADTLPNDTVPAVSLDELVVTGARTGTRLGASVVAASTVSAPELRRLPGAGFAEHVQRVPGFALLDFDGTGYDPQLAVRGFYGGGEAEYVVVLLDGKPLNDLQDGMVAWDLVPPVAVRAVEVVRGGLSALWGDAALGGVINVITEGAGGGNRFDWELEGGAYGAVEGGARWVEPLGGDASGRTASAFVSGRRQDGFREHGRAAAASLGGSVDLLGGPGSASEADAGALSVSVLSAFRDVDRPGPLSAEDAERDPTWSHPFYRFDGTDARVHRMALDGRWGGGLTASLTGELRRTDRVSTVPLTPDFADTRARDLQGRRLSATLRHVGGGVGLTVGDRLVVGADLSVGDFDSEYRSVAAGPPEAYAASSGEPGDVDVRADGSRRAAAAYAQYEVSPVDALRLVAGARVDVLRDHQRAGPVDGEEGDESGAADPGTVREHQALSPKAGLNFRYAGSARHRGHLYLAAGRSFKSPTLDQLFDQRPLPLPEPPFSTTTSNPDLEPQYGTQIEAGLYHTATLSDAAVLGVTLSAYRMWMRDELDFDVADLQYVNIGESRHDGAELGLEITGPRGAHAFLNYTFQDATQRRGEHSGHRLKAIPAHVLGAGASVRVAGGVDAGLFATRLAGAWIDDANTLPLDPHLRLDGRLGWDLAGATVFLEARNLLDASYSTTAFPDPAGTGVVYHHPAAGRSLRLGVRSGG